MPDSRYSFCYAPRDVIVCAVHGIQALASCYSQTIAVLSVVLSWRMGSAAIPSPPRQPTKENVAFTPLTPSPMAGPSRSSVLGARARQPRTSAAELWMPLAGRHYDHKLRCGVLGSILDGMLSPQG